MTKTAVCIAVSIALSCVALFFVYPYGSDLSQTRQVFLDEPQTQNADMASSAPAAALAVKPDLGQKADVVPASPMSSTPVRQVEVLPELAANVGQQDKRTPCGRPAGKYNGACYCGRTKQTNKVLVFYHVQFHAGTWLIGQAFKGGGCGPRACRQNASECALSVSEHREAAHILALNYTIVPYEMMLPPAFPLPFVEPHHRKHFFFVTTMRNPLNRLLSYHFKDFTEAVLAPHSGGYPGTDNFALRWLAGVPSGDVTREHLAIAKCRLNLFDVVMVDLWLNEMASKILCSPAANLGWFKVCPRFDGTEMYRDNARQRLGNDTLFGALVERHRLSFELYDHAISLAADHMVKYGVREVRPAAPPSSFIVALEQSLTFSTETKTWLLKRSIGTRDRSKDAKASKQFDDVVCEQLKRGWKDATSDQRPQMLGGVV